MTQDWQIGMWGPVQSGKTTYLASLYRAGRRFGWEVEALDADTKGFLYYTTAELAKGTFPGSNPQGDLLRYTFGFSEKASSMLNLLRRKPHQRVTLIDVSGEDISGAKPETWDYLDSLRECQGIIVMIDPEVSGHRGYFAPLLQLRDAVSFGGKYFALCITKIDLDQHWEPGLQDPCAYLSQILDEDSLDELHKFCSPKNSACFALSSVGRTRDGSRPNLVIEGSSSGTKSRIARIDEWQPVNLFAPLEWFFGHPQIISMASLGATPE